MSCVQGHGMTLVSPAYIKNTMVCCRCFLLHTTWTHRYIGCLRTRPINRVCCQWTPDNPLDTLAMLKVDTANRQILQFLLFRNVPKIQTYFTVTINICGICLCHKIMYIITRKVYASIKVWRILHMTANWPPCSLYK